MYSEHTSEAPAVSTTPPGWHAAQGDPPDVLRYWNGTEWTEHQSPVAGAVAHDDTAGTVASATEPEREQSPAAGSTIVAEDHEAAAAAQVEAEAASLAEQMLAKRAETAARAQEARLQEAAEASAAAAANASVAAAGGSSSYEPDVLTPPPPGARFVGSDRFAPRPPAARPASALRRIGAAIIDVIFGAILAIPFGVATFASVMDSVGTGNSASLEDIEQLSTDGTIVGIGAAYVVVVFLYRMLGDAFLGGTLGKLITGIRVRFEDDGSEIGPVQAVLRNLNYGVLPLMGLVPAAALLSQAAIFFIGLVSLVWLFIDDNRRTVMDRVAGTVIVHKS